MGASDNLNVPATPTTAPDRAALIAELMNLPDDATPVAPSRVAVSPPVDEAPVEEEVPPDGDEVRHDAADDPPGDDPAEEPEQAAVEGAQDTPAEKAAEDPQISKRLNFLKQQERRIKAEQHQRETQLAAREQELTQAYHAIENFKSVLQAAHRDPAGLLLSLGFSEEQLQDAAQDIFFSSAGAKAHPQYKQAYERAKQQRQSRAEAELARQKAEEVDRKLAEYQATIKHAESMANYKAMLTEAISDDTPFLQMHMKHDREQCRNALMTVAESMYRATGSTPSPQEAATELERRLQADLAVYGVKTPTKANPTAQKPQAKKSLNSNLAGRTPTPGAAEEDPKALRASVLRALETGDFGE